MMRLLLLCLLGATTLLSAQNPTELPSRDRKRSGQYATNGLEKLCLNLSPEGRFTRFSSTCIYDSHHEGTWYQRGDTILLYSDRRPRMHLEAVEVEPAKAAERAEPSGESHSEPANQPHGILRLHASDPAILAAVQVRDQRGQLHRPSRAGEFDWPADREPVSVELRGMESLEVHPPEVVQRGGTVALEWDLYLRFEDLEIDYLDGEAWLIRGRKLQLLSNGPVEEPLEIRKGKRCYYKQ